MADVNMGALLATTLKNYNKTLVDNIHKGNALFLLLKKRGAVKTEDGGERIVQPLMYAKNDTARSYSGWDPLLVTPQEGIDAAEYNWKQYSASIAISGEEMRKNSGSKTRILNLLDARVKQAEMSIREEIGTGIFSDGTGNGGKDLTGLRAMVLNSGTYGGINSATHPWWQANVDTTATQTLALMRTSFNNASIDGNDTPDLLVGTQAVYEGYEAKLTSFNSVVSIQTKGEGEKILGDAGYQTLGFKGKPVIWDSLCPTNYLYYLNLSHMKLVVHSDANFAITDKLQPVNQDGFVRHILFMGNLTCDRRKSFSVQTSLSTP